jgi:hypothetical protein
VRHRGDRPQIGSIAGHGHDHHAALVWRDERDPAAIVTDIAAAQGTDDRARHPAQRRDFPERALLAGSV